jgi:hypothetical protein
MEFVAVENDPRNNTKQKFVRAFSGDFVDRPFPVGENTKPN